MEETKREPATFAPKRSGLLRLMRKLPITPKCIAIEEEKR